MLSWESNSKEVADGLFFSATGNSARTLKCVTTFALLFSSLWPLFRSPWNSHKICFCFRSHRIPRRIRGIPARHFHSREAVKACVCDNEAAVCSDTVWQDHVGQTADCRAVLFLLYIYIYMYLCLYMCTLYSRNCYFVFCV